MCLMSITNIRGYFDELGWASGGQQLSRRLQGKTATLCATTNTSARMWSPPTEPPQKRITKIKSLHSLTGSDPRQAAIWPYCWNCTLTPCLFHHLRIGGQRQQREVLAIEVILEIADAGKAGAGEIRLVPG